LNIILGRGKLAPTTERQNEFPLRFYSLYTLKFMEHNFILDKEKYANYPGNYGTDKKSGEATVYRIPEKAGRVLLQD
jgi:hypothetical protein